MWGNTFFIGLDGWLLTNPVGVGFIAFDGSTATDTIIAIKPDPLDADPLGDPEPEPAKPDKADPFG